VHVQGYRNGYRSGRLRTAEDVIEYAAPQISNRKKPFRSRIRKRLGTRREVLEQLAVKLYAGVLSTRDTEANPFPSRSNLDQLRFSGRERGLPSGTDTAHETALRQGDSSF
jgi:hypothetical protein